MRAEKHRGFRDRHTEELPFKPDNQTLDRVYYVSKPEVKVWVADQNAKCPYCGTAYRLKPGTVVGHH